VANTHVERTTDNQETPQRKKLRPPPITSEFVGDLEDAGPLSCQVTGLRDTSILSEYLAMSFVGVDVAVSCGACGLSQPIGAIVDRWSCQRCDAEIPLPPARWAELLSVAIRQGTSSRAGQHRYEQTADTASSVSFQNQAPVCGACGVEVPAQQALDDPDGKIFCVGCGHTVLTRPAPPALREVAPAIRHIVGEAPMYFAAVAQSAASNSEVVSLRCPSCGGDLPAPDGRTALVTCTFCQAAVLLKHLLPKTMEHMRAHRFFIDVDRGVVKQMRAAREFQWNTLDCLTAGPDGVIYGHGTEAHAGGYSGGPLVFALNPDRSVRWLARGVAHGGDETRIAVTAGGELILWGMRRAGHRRPKSYATRLRCADGAELGQLGGKEPEDANVHHFDMRGCEALTACPDGTLLAFINSRLVRYAPDGQGILTWTNKGFLGLGGDKLRPLRDEGNSSVDVENVRDQPTELSQCLGLASIPDGRIYLHGREGVACLDAEGEVVYRSRLESSNVWDIGADHNGYAYLLRGMSIHRVSPKGKVELYIDGRDESHRIDEKALAVLPDGSLVVGGSDYVCRYFDPQGHLLYRSPTAIENDDRRTRQLANQ
jgi:DNA-directed RNA polymerase subunit RPC12/RpoP